MTNKFINSGDLCLCSEAPKVNRTCPEHGGVKSGQDCRFPPIHKTKRFPVVGIAGASSAGKGTIARVLIEELQFEEIALADPLKMDLSYLHRVLGIEEFSIPNQNAHPRNEIVRAIQQWYGTQIMRKMRGENTWVERAAVPILSAFAHGTLGVCVPDVRFPDDEGKAIVKTWNGLLYYVDRPENDGALQGKLADHDSEGYLEQLRAMSHRQFVNRGIEELREEVREALRIDLGAA